MEFISYILNSGWVSIGLGSGLVTQATWDNGDPYLGLQVTSFGWYWFDSAASNRPSHVPVVTHIMSLCDVTT